MERLYRSQNVGKIYNTISNCDSYEINNRTSYYKYHKNKPILISDNFRENINENLSDISSSVHTSYKYRKRKKGNITLSSKEFVHYPDYHYQEKENDSSISISTNDNLICPDCINDTLIEEKKIRNDLDKRNNKMNIYNDKNDDYENYLDKKIRERENNINYAMQTLSKLNSSISSKERLIQINENSSDPFQGNNRDYQYEKFRKEYDKRQKMINANINKYFPEKNKKSKSELPLFFDKSEEKKKEKEKNKMIKSINMNIRKEYIKTLEEQIKYKNEKKKKEKEEEQKMERKYYEDMEQKMRKEEQEKIIKEKEQKDNFIKSNMDIINNKKRDKMKELREKLKYKEDIDNQNEFYKKELLEKQKENERLLNEIYNSNKKDGDKYKKIKEKERNEKNNNLDSNFNNNNFDNKKYEKINNHYDLEEKKGECCRCHRILPRRLLTINRYFYKENRHRNIY